jgi:hypothetical protein
MQEHFHLVDGVSEAETSSVFNNATYKVIMDTFKHFQLISIAIYYTQVLKHPMKPTQEHGIYLTKDEHLLGMIDWLVEDLEAWCWRS